MKFFKRAWQLPQREWYRLFSKVDDHTMYFESNPDFADNARALFEYLMEQGLNETYRIYWAADRPVPQLDGVKNVVQICKKDKKQVVKALYSSKYIFYTHGLSGWIREKPGQTVVNLWHGCGYKASRNKDRGRFSLRTLISTGKMVFDYVLVPGEVFIETKSEFFRCPKEKVLPIGYPRYDLLRQECRAWPRICEELDIREGGRVVMWMPTYRQTGDASYKEGQMKNQYWLPLLHSDEELAELDRQCARRGITLLIKKHRSQAVFHGDNGRFSSIRFLDDSDLERWNTQLYLMLPHTDALITDYSSIAVDYLLLDKPIAFTLDDYEEYKQLRGFVFEDALAYMPGHHIFETDQLEAFFDDICAGNDRYRDDRRRLMPRMQNPTDSYCRRIAEQFEI